MSRVIAEFSGLRWRLRYLWSCPDVSTIYDSALRNPFRQFLAEVVALPQPQSVLDVGCGFGADLFLISVLLPRARLFGFDINPRVVALGNDELDARGATNVCLVKHSVYRMHDLIPRFGTIMSNASLMYVPSRRIRSVLSRLCSFSDRLVLCELQGSERVFHSKYVHDYVGFFESIGWDVWVHSTRLARGDSLGSDWGRFGAIVEATA